MDGPWPWEPTQSTRDLTPGARQSGVVGYDLPDVHHYVHDANPHCIMGNGDQ